MSYKKDITGFRSGMLVAVERVGKDKNNNALWRCECDCGNEKITRATNIILGQIVSCGCVVRNDLNGKRFGRLTVIKETDKRKNRRIVWECKCDCGNTTFVNESDLVTGHTRSCGCLMRDVVSGTFKKHGQSKTRLYSVWSGMKSRCSDPHHISYHNYGGRGISVCDEWEMDFGAFSKWALSHGYNENAKQGECTLDRIDNDGNYCPENCRWVDMKTQVQNTRRYINSLKGGKKNGTV